MFVSAPSESTAFIRFERFNRGFERHFTGAAPCHVVRMETLRRSKISRELGLAACWPARLAGGS